MFKLSSIPIETSDLREKMFSPEAGAFVSFEGWVRNNNEGKKVIELRYEAFAELCEQEAGCIIDEAKQKFSVVDVICIHRTGSLLVGDLAVFLGVTAAHRDDAFKACRFIIDEIKGRVPIWKKEFYENGNSGWVNSEGNTNLSEKEIC